MTKHNYLTVKTLQEMGEELAGIKEDLEILRGYSDGFTSIKRLDQSEIYMSYVRAFKFMEQFFYKSQRLEDKLEDIMVLLLESGNYDTLQEYLPLKEMDLPKIKT